MNEEHYTVKGFRIRDETYELMKEAKGTQSWNLYLFRSAVAYMNYLENQKIIGHINKDKYALDGEEVIKEK